MRYQDFLPLIQIYLKCLNKILGWRSWNSAIYGTLQCECVCSWARIDLEPSYRYLNPGASIHPIWLIYRNNDHNNSLTTKSNDNINEPKKVKKNLPKI